MTIMKSIYDSNKAQIGQKKVTVLESEWGGGGEPEFFGVNLGDFLKQN